MQAAFISESLYSFIFLIPQFLLCHCSERRNCSFGLHGNSFGIAQYLHLTWRHKIFLSIKSCKRKEKKEAKFSFSHHTRSSWDWIHGVNTKSEILAPLKLMAKFPLTSAGPGFHPLSISSSTRSRKYWKALDRACSHDISSPDFQALLLCIVLIT